MDLIPLHKLFHVEYGNSFDLTMLTRCTDRSHERVNYVSRTRENNGVSAIVERYEDVEPFPPGLITVAGSGNSVLEACIQPFSFYTGYHVFVLTPLKEMSELVKLFYCYCIKENRYKYNFGRQANRTLKDLLVPKHVPKSFLDIDIESLAEINSTPVAKKAIDIDTSSWKYFKIGAIFKLEKCKCSNATDLLEDGNDIYYVGAKKDDNGIIKKVAYNEDIVSRGNCIVFIGDGQGSVGYCTYQPNDFIGSTTLTCGYNDNLNPFNAIFLITVLDKERFKYSFGRKYGKAQLLKSKIKLPAIGAEPDFLYMENYIKSLPFSSSINSLTENNKTTIEKESKNKNKGLSDEELIKKYEAGKVNIKKAI